MNNNPKIPFTSKLIKQILSYLGSQLAPKKKNKAKDALDFELQLSSCLSQKDTFYFQEAIAKWWSGETKYLVFNSNEIKGLSLRLYKAQLQLVNHKLNPTDEFKIAGVYFRYRDILTTKLKTVKLGDLSNENLSKLVKSATQLKSGNHLGIKIIEKQKSGAGINICETSLRDFLYSDYLETKRYENPRTAMSKVKKIERNFLYLIDKPISEITAVKIREWMHGKERTLTKRQLAAGESLWNVKPSTMKEILCTLRACIQLAKNKGIILDHDLYSLPKIRVDNQVIRYLSDDEELRLYGALNRRNTRKHEQRERTIDHRQQRRLLAPPSLKECQFADHVTPFIILFKETGIRPGTLFNSRWADVDFESRFFRIRKALDKRGVSNFIPLNDLALATLTEWRKHQVHKTSSVSFKVRSDAWLFPSPLKPHLQITTIKKPWERLLKDASIESFRLYDLRHDFASKVMMQTGNIYMVSQLLNHKQIETTKRYAHLMDRSRFDAVGKLDLSRQKDAMPDFLK